MIINQILEGWGNLIKDKLNSLDPTIKAVATIRLSHCDKCPIRKNNTCDPSGTIEHIQTKETVKGCGCNIAAKTLSMQAQCPAGKW